MSRTVALSTLRSDVRFKADVGGATVRHTDAQLNRLINQSIQMFRERISDEGSTHYLVPYSGTLGVGPTSPYAFYQLDLSSGPSPALVRTYGIDVTIDGVVCKLEHVPFEARNDYGTIHGGSRPVAWCHFRTDQVGILPASSSAYPFTVWYLPKFTDLSADGDTFDGVAGWEEWVVWDVVCQVIARDQFPQAFAIAEQRRAEVEQRVIRGATKVTQAGGAHVGRDSFGGKLPHFLGGSRRPQAAAGGPYVPAGGSVTDAMLADMTGPTVKGVLSGTTRPYSIGIGTLTPYLAQFSTLQQGLVPPPLSVGGRFLDDSGAWSVPPGGAGGGSAGPSGAVQFQLGTGMGGASGFRVIGNSPSLLLRLDGSLRVTGGDVAVGSGTVRVTPSGVDVGDGSIVNVATLVASALAAPAVTDTTAGLAPASGGGTANFLRADGTWAAPPGGASSPGGSSGNVQYNDGAGGFGGATAVSVITSLGGGLAFGDTAALDAASVTGNMRSASGWQHGARVPSGGRAILQVWTPASRLLQWGSNGAGALVRDAIANMSWDTASGAAFTWRAGGELRMRSVQTGIDAVGPFSMPTGDGNFRAIAVASGIGNQYLGPMGSGTIKGNLSGTGTPQDIAVATLHAFAPTFTSTNPGTVPESGGGTTNFLRADGSWAAPGGGGNTFPALGSGAIQYNGTNNAFSASNNWSFGPSGTQLLSGAPTGLTNASGASVFASADQGVFGNYSIQGRSTKNENQPLYEWRPSGGTVSASQATGGLITYGRGSGTIQLHRFQTAPSGSIEFELGPSGAQSLRFMPTGVDFKGHPLAVKSLRVVDTIPNSELASMASGTVKGQLGPAGTPNDVSIATLFAFAPTFTSAQRGIVPASGGGTTNYLRADGSWTAPSGAAQYPPVGGVTNVEMAVMPTGTVKGNLSGNATPSDVSVNTMLAFAPTFTSVTQGVVPPSGGGTTNFLRADGTWTTPAGAPATPGGGPNSIQFNDNGVTNGASGYGFSSAGGALGIGVPSFLPGFGDIRVASGFNITANLPSGIGGVAARQQLFDWSGGGASGVLDVGGASGILGTIRNEVATGGAFEWLIGGRTGMALRPTGLDAAQFHIKAKSIDVGHINGLPFDLNALKRGLDIGNSSGLPSGLNLYLPRGAGSGANRYIIPSGVNGTGTQAAPRFVTLSPTGLRGGGVIRIERVTDGDWPFEVRTPTGTVLHSFPSGAKGWADFMGEKPSGAVFQLAGHADMY